MSTDPRVLRATLLAGLAGLALHAPVGVAGYQKCNGEVVADSVSRCPDGSIPIYTSSPPPAPAPRPASTPAPAPRPNGGLVAVAGGERFGLRCPAALECGIGEGAQPGLSTLEIAGRQPGYAGRSLKMLIVDLATRASVEERKVGVFSDGHYTTSVALFRLPPGEYAVAFASPDGADVLGVAHFTLPGQAAKPPDDGPSAAPATQGVLGDWYGTNVAGSFTLRADGRYSSANGASGHWHAAGRDVVFTSGPLTAWNQGRATLAGNGALEFYWTTPEGAKQYFAFVRR